MEIVIIVAIVLWIILCFVVADAWKNVGLSYTTGFWNSFLFSPLIGILLGILFVCSRNSRGVVGEKEASNAESGTQKSEVEEVATRIYCPYCGKETSSEKQVCQECGKNLYKIFEESEYECSDCKHNIPEDASYCYYCGEKFE